MKKKGLTTVLTVGDRGHPGAPGPKGEQGEWGSRGPAGESQQQYNMTCQSAVAMSIKVTLQTGSISIYPC